ncbi:hypothetical protein GCM10010420_23110 [Streptomyces glaucosporus]|uniref:Lipoprotein n=1 Tax=Streptomyces glaucosporus TaxID=284044 RepID=A0ABN3I7G1_9ACTN
MVTCRTARPVRPALAAALAACALALSAAPAAVGEEPGPAGSRTASPGATGTAPVRVTPATARPGAEIMVTAPGCGGTRGTARSAVFVADAALAPSAGGGLFGETRIRSDAEEGRHRITVECEGADGGLTGRLTVRRSASGAPSSPAASPTASPKTSPAVSPTGTPAVSPSPVAPVPAGGGGTAERDGERSGDAGPGALHTALGVGLAGAATLVVARRAVVLRRRNRSDTDR